MSGEADPSPFGPDTQKYWNRRYEYFSRFDEGIQLDAEGLYSVMPEDAALAQAHRIRSPRVLDAFAGVGGNAIGFARAGKSVVAIEADLDRLQMAINNAGVYGVADRITFIHGDALDLLDDYLGEAIYLDPPWGGPAYKSHGSFHLDYFDPDGATLLELTLGRFPEVALRVPRTFDVADLSDLGYPFEVHDDLSLGRQVSRTVYFGAKSAAEPPG
jgi:trimethylguanosine synthase